MKLNRSTTTRLILVVSLLASLSLLSSRMDADSGTCGGQMTALPFIDVPGNSTFFCTIAAAYFTGLTAGTDATHYSPSSNVTRDQMSAFITRTLDQAVKRSSRRIVLRQTWNTQDEDNLQMIDVGGRPSFVASDGEDLWVANNESDTVSRVHASSGKLLGTWTGFTDATGVLCAMGKVFVTGTTIPGKLFRINPTDSSGSAFTLSSSLGSNPAGIAFDGQRIWTANFGNGSVMGSISIIPVDSFIVTNVTTGLSSPIGIIFDGTHIWVTDGGDAKLKKVDSSGNVLTSVNVGAEPRQPSFDGTNIWVPSTGSDTVTVVRVKDAAGKPLAAPFVLATLTGNGLNDPVSASFDGERILVTNITGNSVSLWKASDLTPIGTFSTGTLTNPSGACSDGLNFWITLRNPGRLARF